MRGRRERSHVDRGHPMLKGTQLLFLFPKRYKFNLFINCGSSSWKKTATLTKKIIILTNQVAPGFSFQVSDNILGANDAGVVMQHHIGQVIEVLQATLTQRTFLELLPVGSLRFRKIAKWNISFLSATRIVLVQIQWADTNKMQDPWEEYRRKKWAFCKCSRIFRYAQITLTYLFCLYEANPRNSFHFGHLLRWRSWRDAFRTVEAHLTFPCLIVPTENSKLNFTILLAEFPIRISVKFQVSLWDRQSHDYFTIRSLIMWLARIGFLLCNETNSLDRIKIVLETQSPDTT